MKKFNYILPLLLLSVLVFTGCGYRNPNVYTGPEKNIYITNWNNKTNLLSLDIDIYQSLVKWFQKSGKIIVTNKREGADLILAGEILSIDQPSLSYGQRRAATEVKLKLTIRYIIKDLNSGTVILEVPSELWSEDYLVGDTSSETSDNEKEALDTIIDDLSQKIYRAAIKELTKE